MVRYGDTGVVDMPMAFCMTAFRQELTGAWTDPSPAVVHTRPCVHLLRLPLTPTASKEDIIRRYDHEVRGGTVVPTLGPRRMDQRRGCPKPLSPPAPPLWC